jgi:hypothetical protein
LMDLPADREAEAEFPIFLITIEAAN